MKTKYKGSITDQNHDYIFKQMKEYKKKCKGKDYLIGILYDVCMDLINEKADEANDPKGFYKELQTERHKLNK